MPAVRSFFSFSSLSLLFRTLGVLLLAVAVVGCESNASITIPGGCDACVSFDGVTTKEESLKILENSRCAVEPGGKTGVCLNCRLDEHCQSPSAPTRKCTANHKCICGSDKDCSKGQFCLGEQGCVQCTKDEHCAGTAAPFCVYNSCDGLCKPGSTQSCKKDGACNGMQTCSKLGRWGDCESSGGKPEKELCDQRDNDCDGLVDEDFPQIGKSCSEKVGPCDVTGTWQCKPDATGVFCKGETKGSKPETCNGIDDDCNGLVDDGLTPEPCDNQKGVCKGATRTCGGEKGWLPCDDAVFAKHSTDFNKEFDGQNEATCDGLDNNCNGDVDESPVTKAVPCNDPTGNGSVGECKKGRTSCKDKKTICLPGAPSTEVCDGKDNDCDGQVDEDFKDKDQPCTAGQGGCKQTGKRVCTSDGKGTECSAKEVSPQPETCNGKDDDCNGMVDDGLTGTCQIAGKKGACATGLKRCENGVFSCVAVNFPSKEVPDNKDNDCDGFVDEGLVSLVLSTKGLYNGKNLYITGIAVNAKQEIFVSAWNSHCIYKIDPVTKKAVLVAGKEGNSDMVDSLTDPLKARFDLPNKLSFDPTGTHLFVSDYNNQRVRRIDGLTGAVTTYATGVRQAADLAQDQKGTVYVVNQDNLYKVGVQGTATKVSVGSSKAQYSMQGLTIDSKDRVYYLSTMRDCYGPGSCNCDGIDCHGVFQLGGSSIIPLAGTCQAKCNPIAGGSRYRSLRAFGEQVFAIYDKRQIYMIADKGQPKRVLVAGNGNSVQKDGVLAINSGFNNIGQFAFDKQGNLYIADTSNYAIRMVKGPIQ